VGETTGGVADIGRREGLAGAAAGCHGVVWGRVREIEGGGGTIWAGPAVRPPLSVHRVFLGEPSLIIKLFSRARAEDGGIAAPLFKVIAECLIGVVKGAGNAAQPRT